MPRAIKKRIKEVLFCWDFALPALVSLTHYLVTSNATLDSLRETSSFGAVNLIVILTILFAVFAIIAATSTSEFVSYLKKMGVYDGMIWRFSYVTYTISSSIIYSFVVFFLVDVDVFEYAINNSLELAIISLHSINVFAILYSFCCVVNTAGEMILFSRTRAQFVSIREKRYLISRKRQQ